MEEAITEEAIQAGILAHVDLLDAWGRGEANADVRSQVLATLQAALPHLVEVLVPSLQEVANTIDENHDESTYAPIYDEEGNCVSSAAAQAVLALLPTSSGVQRGKLFVEVLARTWKEGYATGVMHERMRVTYPKHNIPQPKNPFEEVTEETIMAKLDDMGQIQGQTTIYDHLGIQDPQKKEEEKK